MSGLIIPGEPRRGGLTIYVPGKYADTPGTRFVCRVPTGPRSVCGAEFTSHASLMRHLRNECVSRHEQEIRTLSLKQRMPMFQSWDPEVDAHMKKVRDRMLKEGRWHVKPNERAGFS